MIRVKWILAAVAALATHSATAATITIVNLDGPGEGLNDLAPFTPIGGNSATTLGAARLAVLQEAARVWGQQLTSPVNIVVEAQFNALSCSASSGTLGGAGPVAGFSNFLNAPLPNVAYPAALADALAGFNIANVNDIAMTFNSSINGSTSCLGGTRFYLGFDHQHGVADVDLLNVAMHELVHGLGFIDGVDQNGASELSSGQLTVYAQFVYSESLGLFWPQMTPAERAASLISNNETLVWNGPQMNAVNSQLTGGRSVGSHIKLYAPATYSGSSTASHWDITAEWIPSGLLGRSLLMEPFDSANPLGLTDFTGCALADMGWTGTRCTDRAGVSPGPTAQAKTVPATEDTAVQITLVGTDPDTPSLTYSIVTPPTRGTLTPPASLVSSTGVIYTYTPSANLNGADSFAFQVNDGTSSSAPATVTINVAAVNDAPVANSQTVSATAGTTRSVTLTGSDVEGSILTYAIVAGPAKGGLSGTAPNLMYTANSGARGADSFTFRVNDGALNSAIATVTINIAAQPGGGGGGGGGSLDWPGLLLLAGLLGWSLRGRPPLTSRPS